MISWASLLHVARPAVRPSPPPARCGDCAHFRNDPEALERAFPGFTSMGSARADVRACDGLCHRHGRYLSFSESCGDFRPAAHACAARVNS